MNNKIVIAIVMLISVGVFAWLAGYGWRNRYGSPETYEIVEPGVLLVSYQDQDLALNEADIFADIWQNVPGLEVKLMHQITEKPWPKGHTPKIQVQAFHNGRDIYFKATWKDDQANTTKTVDTFVDGCAIAIPMDVEAPVRSIMMGFSSPVNIWNWQADDDMLYWQGKTGIPDVAVDFTYPFENEETLSVTIPKPQVAVMDLIAQRAGSLTRKDNQIVQGRGLWRDGSWSVVFKRSLTTEDQQQDSQFSGPKHSVSFAVWDGDQDDRGSRKSISEWVKLQIQSPQSKESAGEQTSVGTGGTHAYRESWIDKLPSFSLVSTAYGADSQDQPAKATQEPRVITITAKRFEYTPKEISIEKGERVTIRLESLDVTHGLYLDGYGIKMKARPGLIGKATFVADKSGRFTFRCSETCGEFHPYMIGFLTVTPNSRFKLFVVGMCVASVLIAGLVLRGRKQNNGVETNASAE